MYFDRLENDNLCSWVKWKALHATFAVAQDCHCMQPFDRWGDGWGQWFAGDAHGAPLTWYDAAEDAYVPAADPPAASGCMMHTYHAGLRAADPHAADPQQLPEPSQALTGNQDGSLPPPEPSQAPPGKPDGSIPPPEPAMAPPGSTAKSPSMPPGCTAKILSNLLTWRKMRAGQTPKDGCSHAPDASGSHSDACLHAPAASGSLADEEELAGEDTPLSMGLGHSRSIVPVGYLGKGGEATWPQNACCWATEKPWRYACFNCHKRGHLAAECKRSLTWPPTKKAQGLEW